MPPRWTKPTSAIASGGAATCAAHCLSYGALFLALPPGRQHLAPFTLTVVFLGWVTWAASAMALLLKRVGDYLVVVPSKKMLAPPVFDLSKRP